MFTIRMEDITMNSSLSPLWYVELTTTEPAFIYPGLIGHRLQYRSRASIPLPFNQPE